MKAFLVKKEQENIIKKKRSLERDFREHIKQQSIIEKERKLEEL